MRMPWSKTRPRSSSPLATRTRRAARPTLESVEPRVVMSVSAAVVNGQLIVTGDNAKNFIEIDHNPRGTFVNGQRFNDAAITKGIVINSGFNDDLVDVLATEKPITINGQGGLDSVTIGRIGTVQTIHAEVFTTNEGGFTRLQVADQLDDAPRNVNMTVNFNLNLGIINGLAPARITYRPGDLSELNIFGGNGGNTYTIDNTFQTTKDSSTTIFAGRGNDAFRVRGTNGALSIFGNDGDDSIVVGSLSNTLDGIKGQIVFRGEVGQDPVTLNDQGSITPHTYTIVGSELQRSGSASVFISQTEGLAINKGPTNNASPAAKGLKMTQQAKPGQPVTLTGRLTDADKADKLTLTVDWGDGSKTTEKVVGREPFAVKHKFATAGQKVVRVIWTDSKGESNFREMKVKVKA